MVSFFFFLEGVPDVVKIIPCLYTIVAATAAATNPGYNM
jgi:hypothetical protein